MVLKATRILGGGFVDIILLKGLVIEQATPAFTRQVNVVEHYLVPSHAFLLVGHDLAAFGDLELKLLLTLTPCFGGEFQTLF